MADAAAISRWFPGRGQRCQNFAECCFDRGGDALPQLQIISGLPSVLICALRQRAERAALCAPIFGAVHSAPTLVVLVIGASWWRTRMLSRIEAIRVGAEGASQKQEEQVRQLNGGNVAVERASV